MAFDLYFSAKLRSSPRSASEGKVREDIDMSEAVTVRSSFSILDRNTEVAYSAMHQVTSTSTKSAPMESIDRISNLSARSATDSGRVVRVAEE